MSPTVQFILQNKNLYQAQLAKLVGYGCCVNVVVLSHHNRTKE